MKRETTRWRLKVELSSLVVFSSPQWYQSEEKNGVIAELLLLCCEHCLEDPRGKSANISAKTVSELVRAKSSEIDIVR